MSRVYRFNDLPKYQLGACVVRNILRKTTGELNAIAMDALQSLEERVLPFDVYIQVIEGQLESTINGIVLHVNASEYLIIPAHARHSSKAVKRTKLLHLVIKSGYDLVV